MEVQRLSFGEFPEELWPHFSLFQLVSTQFLEGQRFSRRRVSGGDFRRWSVLYMVSGFCPGW